MKSENKKAVKTKSKAKTKKIENKVSKTANAKTNNKNKKNSKKMETSKIIILVNYFLAIIITIYTMIYTWQTNDSSPLTVLITSLFAAYGASNAFYFWKAKNENIVKYSNKLDKLTRTRDIINETTNVINDLQNNNDDNNNNNYIV